VSKPSEHLGGPEMAPPTPQAAAAPGHPSGSGALVLAIVKDLFFVARIRETARLVEVPLVIARSPQDVEAALTARPRFALLDLTGGFDYEGVFRSLEGAGVPVLAFTTHALAAHTKPWHSRCARVVTKETLTAELPRLLREGAAA
jgi:hypothetical protein